MCVYNVQSGDMQRHMLPPGPYHKPELAWSACARYVSLSTSPGDEPLHVLDTVSGTAMQLKVWPGASAWHPRASWLLTVSTQLALEVFSFEDGQPCRAAKLNLRPVVGSVRAADGCEFALVATMDGSRVIVGKYAYGEENKPWPVAVAQIKQPCVLLGRTRLRGRSSEAMFLSFCVGISVCAACAASFRQGSVHLIALDGPQVGQVIRTVQGVGPALSPCGSYLAVVCAGLRYEGDCVEVSRLREGRVVACWWVSDMTGDEPDPGSCLGTTHVHQLTWLPAPPRTGGQATGQLQLSSLLDTETSTATAHFTRFWLVLTF